MPETTRRTPAPFAPFRLRGYVRREITELATDLPAEIADLHNALALRGDMFRDSAEGAAVTAWIATLEHLADHLDTITDAEPKG